MSTFDYGPPHDDAELQRWSALVARTFSMPAAELPAWLDQLGRDAGRCLRTRQGLVAGLGVLEMGQWFGGRSVPMGGILAVAVEPEQRGRGVARELMARELRALHQRGFPLSGLYPATNTLYRSVGYEVAGARHELGLKLRELAFARGVERDPAVWLRPARAEDEPALRAVYARRAAHAQGWLDRHEYLWRRVRSWRGEERQGFVAGRGDAIEGYAYVVQRRGNLLELELAFSDFVAVHAGAAVRLVELLAEHRSLCPWARGFLAPSDPVLGLLAENGFESKLSMPWMLRLVDVRAALRARGWPACLRARLDLEVVDELLPHNAGRIVLTLEDGAARVEPGGSGALALDVKALAALYTGWQSAFDLAASGRARGDEAVLARASACFASAPPHMPDMY